MSQTTLPKIQLPKTNLWINGQWKPSLSGKRFASINPATEEILAEIAEADEKDVDEAVQAARRAFESGPWPRMKAAERAKILQTVAQLVEKHSEDLALLETLDSGKPLQYSRIVDMPASVSALNYYAGWADKLYGETIPADPEYFSYTLREPLGVIGAITPWNFPFLMAIQKVAPALASGNTMVLKPAEQTPLTALKLAELFEEAGLPAGVLNIVPGFGPTAGAALVRHPEVDGITFTGEYKTGQEIMKNAAGTLKRICFELGGKSAQIIFADADLDQAVDFACDGIFFNQGEVCNAGSRLFVDQKIRESFTEKLLTRAKNWQPGNPLDSKTEMGAIVSKEQYEKILHYIEIGQKEGAKLALDGRLKKNKGYFVGPTIFTGVQNQARLAQEEIFGPVLAEIAFSDFETVIQQANDSFYGLAAAVWTRDIQKAHRAAQALKVGTVWINCFSAFNHAMPFGGYKMSGFGREGGIHTFDFYTQTKSVWVKL